MSRRFAFSVVVALLVLVAPAALVNAHSYKLGAIAIGHVWAPPATKDTTGAAVYGPLLNGGDKLARLVGATTPIAKSVRFRLDKDGATQWLPAIDLPPGKPVSLAAWREHIWLDGLARPLKEGDSFDLTLDFGDAGKLTVKIMVQKTPSD